MNFNETHRSGEIVRRHWEERHRVSAVIGENFLVYEKRHINCEHKNVNKKSLFACRNERARPSHLIATGGAISW